MYQKEKSSWIKHLDFIILDIICMQTAVVLAYLIRFRDMTILWDTRHRQMSIALFVVGIITAFLAEGYHGILRRGYLRELKHTLDNVTLSVVGYILFNFVTSQGKFHSRFIVVSMWILGVVLCYGMRCLRKCYIKSHKNGGVVKANSIIIVTECKGAKEAVLRIMENHERRVSGMILMDQKRIGDCINGIEIVADRESAESFLRQNWVDEVIFFLPRGNQTAFDNLITDCREMGITVHIPLYLWEEQGNRKRIETVGGYKVITSYMPVPTNKQRFMKRCMDLCGALFGCLITFVLFVFVAPAIYLASPGPVIRSQSCVGKDGQLYKMYEFRSMHKDGSGIIKGIGYIIQKTSINKFPQFFNVLKGDMSLVGIKPQTMDEWEKCGQYHHKRNRVKPGIIGMWQTVTEDDNMDEKKVVELDEKYMANWSVGLDIKLLFRSINMIFKSKKR